MMPFFSSKAQSFEENLKEIRSLYQTLTEEFPDIGKQFSDEFEDRYFASLKKNTDYQYFMLGEKDTVLALLSASRKRSEEQKLKEKKIEESSKKIGAIYDEYNKRISRYPSYTIEDFPIDYEVEKLIGYLIYIEKEYWPHIEKLFSKIYRPVNNESGRFYTALREFCPSGKELPHAMLHYVQDIKKRCPAKQIEDSKNKVIKEAAIYLNKLLRLLIKAVEDTKRVPAADSSTVEDISRRLANAIKDFRIISFSGK